MLAVFTTNLIKQSLKRGIEHMPAMQEVDLAPKTMPCDRQIVPIQAAAALL